MDDDDGHSGRGIAQVVPKETRAHLRILGEFRLECPAGSPITLNSRKAKALLAYLALSPDQRVTRDTLAGLLWGGSEQSRARQNLRQTICVVKGVLEQRGLPLVRPDNQALCLVKDRLAVDALAFDRLVGEDSTSALARASVLYGGDLLSGFSVDAPEFEDWLRATRDLFRDKALFVLTKLANAYEREERLDLAIQMAGKALSVDRYREDIHRQLMRIYAAKGLRATALNQYWSCRRILSEELGVAPDDRTVRLYREIKGRGANDPPGIYDQKPGKGDRQEWAQEAQRFRPVSDHVTVGREADVKRLETLVQELPSTGSRVALVEGETGVGKTHVLDRFIPTTSSQETVVVASRGYKSGKESGFGLWLDALERLLAHPMASEALAELRSVHSLMRDGEVTLEHEARPIACAPAIVGRLMAAAIRRVAARKRVVLVCDDLQWADDDSLRTLFHLAKSLDEAPVLILLAASEERGARPALMSDALHDLDRDGRLIKIRLDPLTRKESIELAWQLQHALNLKRDSRTRLNQIWLMSEGNPRVIREAVLAAAADNSRASSDEMPVPEILLDEAELLQDRLSPTAREMLAFAAVMGRQIDYRVLARAMGLNDTIAATAVEELANEGVFAKFERELIFKHRRVILATRAALLARRRELIHAAIAQAIIDSYPHALEPHYHRLAHHCREAGETERALAFGLSAAYVELNGDRRPAARRSFQSALKTACRLKAGKERNQGRIQAHLGLAYVAEADGNLARAGRCLDEAEALVGVDIEPRQRALMYLARARLSYRSGDLDRSYASARRALAEVDTHAPCYLWSPAENVVARVHLIGGNMGRVADSLDERRQRALNLGMRRDAAEAAAVLGLLRGMRGDVGEARERCAEAARLAHRNTDEAHLIVGLQAQGLMHTWQGEWSSARACLERALGIAQNRGDVLRIYALTGLAGYNEVCACECGEAVRALERAIAMAGHLNTRTLLPLFKAWLAEASVGERGDEEVLRLSGEALHLSSQCNHAWARSAASRALARALSEGRGEFGVADRVIRKAIAQQFNLGLSFEAARSLLVHARILRIWGEANRSRQIAKKAGDIFARVGLGTAHERVRAMVEAP